MARRRRLIQLMVTMMIILVGISTSVPARADDHGDGEDRDGRTTTEHYTTTIPVSWEMTPERCGRLKATTRGAGNMVEKVTIKRHNDGSIDVFVSDTVDNTASDDNGVSYR